MRPIRILSLVVITVTLIASVVAVLSKTGASDGGSPPAASLEQLFSGRLKIVDLTYPLNAASAFWPGQRYQPFRLESIATLQRDGVLSKAFSTPEHLGTHIDAPNHFEPNQPSVDQIPAEQLFVPGVMIDAIGPASADADYQLSAQDVRNWEQTNGRVPPGAVVLLNTGWGRHWGTIVRFQNKDVQGRMHFPGYSTAAAALLVEERGVRGIGIDTLSIDYGLSRDFAVHHLVNSHGRYGLENVAGLEQLPATGFYLVIAPIKIETGSGGPTRIFAILP